MTLTKTQQAIAEALRGGVISVLRTEGIYGRGYRFRQAKELLSQTNIQMAIETMALMNAVAWRMSRLRDRQSKEFLQHLGKLYGFLFPKHLINRVVQFSGRELRATTGPFYPLSPWACAAMTDAALRFCHLTNGAAFFPPRHAGYVAKILVTYQTRLAPDRNDLPDFDHLPDERFAEYSRNYLRANLPAVTREDKGRLFALFEIPEISAVLLAKTGKPAGSWFQEQMGLSAREYRLSILGLMHLTTRFNLDRPDWNALTFDVRDFLANLTESAREPFIRLLDLATIDLGALRASPGPSDWKSASYGGNSLVQRQLVLIGPGKYVVLHESFFFERYFRGLVHVLDAVARLKSPDRWKQVRREFGYLFEGYIHWWLKQLFGPDSPIVFGYRHSKVHETDAVVLVKRTAFVFELNHHPLSRIDAFEATPEIFAQIVSSDLTKALRAARVIATDGITIEGQLYHVDRIYPIAVIPEALPIGDMTAIRFKQELLRTVPNLDGDGPMIGSCQVLSQQQLEFLDRVWNLPADVLLLSNYLVRRSTVEPARFGPLAFDLQQLTPTHLGNTWSRIYADEEKEFRESGPKLFQHAQ